MQSTDPSNITLSLHLGCRLVLYSTEEVQPYDRATDRRYANCGNMKYVEGVERTGDDIVLRFFSLRLSELHKFTNAAKRVYLYTQTLVIDTDIQVTHALLIRATQILLDPTEDSYNIALSLDAPHLGIDLDHVKYKGPEPNIQFMKESLTCARILQMHSKGDMITWSILNDLIKSTTAHTPVKNIQSLAETYRMELSNLVRNDIEVVPFYSLQEITDILQVHRDRIQTRKMDIQQLESLTDSDTSFTNYATEMNNIYVQASVSRADIELSNGLNEFRRAKQTYALLHKVFQDSKDILEEKRDIFVAAIDQHRKYKYRQQLLDYVNAAVQVIQGIKDVDLSAVVGGVTSAYGISSIDSTLAVLEDVVGSIKKLNEDTSNIQRSLAATTIPFENQDYIYQINHVAAMHKQVEAWRDFCTESKKILENDAVMEISSAGDYGLALLDVCNKGIAVTKAMIERAEMMRELVVKRKLLDTYKEQRGRSESALRNLQNDQNAKQAVVTAMREQVGELAQKLNDVIILFCQAYMFERLDECPDNIKPKFGGTLSELMDRIDDAKEHRLTTGLALSTANFKKDVVDLDNDQGTSCRQAAVNGAFPDCPVTYFCQNKALAYEVCYCYSTCFFVFCDAEIVHNMGRHMNW